MSCSLSMPTPPGPTSGKSGFSSWRCSASATRPGSSGSSSTSCSSTRTRRGPPSLPDSTGAGDILPLCDARVPREVPRRSGERCASTLRRCGPSSANSRPGNASRARAHDQRRPAPRQAEAPPCHLALRERAPVPFPRAPGPRPSRLRLITTGRWPPSAPQRSGTTLDQGLFVS